jgi:hypothetical protein
MGKTAVTWTDARLDDLADVVAPLPAEVAMLKATVNHWDHLPLHLNPCPLASLCWLPPLNAWRRRTALFAQNSRRRSANFSRSPGVSWWRSSARQPHSFPHWCDGRTVPRLSHGPVGSAAMTRGAQRRCPASPCQHIRSLKRQPASLAAPPTPRKS